MQHPYPAVEFESSEWGSELRVESPTTENLMDLCDETGAPVPFSCRGASCSTCRIEVLEGLELLNPPNSFEQELIDSFKTPSHIRFACQLVLRPQAAEETSPPRVRIKALGAID